jgi:spore photoproduct lyase
MSQKASQSGRRFSDIKIHSHVENSPISNRVKDSFEEVRSEDEKNIIPNYRDGKRVISVTPKKGETMDVCATISDKYVCCNVQVLKSVSNCPFDCSYCFLQNYLNDGTTSVVGDVNAMMDEVREKCEAQPWRLFRIGTWELGDSLALEPETGQAELLIAEFAALPNAILELKTKSDCVDSILQCDHRGKTVVSWSMSTEHIINQQEHRTAPLSARLIALKKVVQAGYLVGIHFDPMIRYDGWEHGYSDLVNAIFSILPVEQTAWVSMGSLRFNPEQKNKMEENFPASDLTLQEMVLGDDGKVRYVKPHRVEMYRFLLDCLTKYKVQDSLLYLCMERWSMWDQVLGYHPESIQDLDYLFAHSITTRYPDRQFPSPNRDQYLNEAH